MATKKQAASDPKEKTVYSVKMSDYTSPKMVDDPRAKFITWGEANSFWTDLNELFYNSPSNAACINGIVRLAFGDGLVNADGSEPNQVLSLISKKDTEKLMLQFVKSNKMVLQVDYKDGKKKGVHYLAGSTVALGKRDEIGDIREIFYSKKGWGKRTPATPYPAFGFGGSKPKTEIYFGQKAFDTDAYYSPVDYQSGIPYAQLEIETANYHINHSKNAFTSSAIINLNGGVPDKNVREDIISDIVDSRTGSDNAGKVVVLFNRDSSQAATIESFDIPDAHKQYEFVSQESMEKIFVAHNITSPLLLGIRDTGGGLGSNADEIKDSYALFNMMVLEPIRKHYLSALTEIMPVEMAGVEFKQFDYYLADETIEEGNKEPEVQMSAQSDLKEVIEMTDDDTQAWIERLSSAGEVDDDEEWGLIGESEAGSMEDEIAEENRMVTQFAKNPPSPKPQSESKDGDTGLYKIRYAYTGKASPDSRDFCKFMAGERQKGKVYRREDIEAMSDSGVNGDFAPQGKSKYDIFTWKGGVYCHHKWMRRVYFRKRAASGGFLPKSKTARLENDKRVTVDQAKKAGVPTSKLDPVGTKKAETKPIDTPSRGSLKNK